MLRIVCSLLVLLVSPLVFAQSATVAVDDGDVAIGAMIQLESAGEAPLRTLRYDLASFGEQAVQMDTAMTMSMAMGGPPMEQVIPTMRTTVRVTDATEQDGGTLLIRYQVAEMQVMPGTPGVMPMVEEAVRQSLAGIGVMDGTLLINERGEVLESDFDLSNLDEAMRQQLESTLQAVEQSVVPFPVEPVGVGAAWSATVDINAGGMALSQTARFEVTEITDEFVRISSRITQSAGQQQLQAPGMPPGANAELVRYQGSGVGNISIRFDSALPDGTVDMESEMTMRVGETGGMAMSMDMTMEMSSTFTTLP